MIIGIFINYCKIGPSTLVDCLVEKDGFYFLTLNEIQELAIFQQRCKLDSYILCINTAILKLGLLTLMVASYYIKSGSNQIIKQVFIDNL